MASPQPGSVLVYDATANDPTTTTNSLLSSIKANTTPNTTGSVTTTIAQGVVGVVTNTAVGGVGSRHSLGSGIESIAQLNTAVLVNDMSEPTTYGAGDILASALFAPNTAPITSSFPNYDQPNLVFINSDTNPFTISQILAGGLFPLGVGQPVTPYLETINNTLTGYLGTISSKLQTIINCLEFEPISSMVSTDSGENFSPVFGNRITLAEIMYRGLYSDVPTMMTNSGTNSNIAYSGLPLASMSSLPYANPANAASFYDAVVDVGADINGYRSLTQQDGAVSQALRNEEILNLNSLYPSSFPTVSYDYISTALVPTASLPQTSANALTTSGSTNAVKVVGV
jgi:hypothetical protein